VILLVIVRKILYDFVSYILSFCSPINRVIQEKRSVLSDVIFSVIVRKIL